MASLKQFKLPDLGEGLTEGEIIRWLVQPGDQVRLNQPIVEVETAKAAVEVPSPYAGVVTELHHAEGSTVDVGSPLITFDTDPRGSGAPAGEAPAGGEVAGRGALKEDLVPVAGQAAGPPPADGGELAGDAAPGGRTSVLVGYGPKSAVAKRRPRKGAGDVAEADQQPAPPGSAESTGPPEGALPRRPAPARVSAAAVGARAQEVATEVSVLAKPPVRKLARDLGVDLRVVQGSGPHGSITRTDVEDAAGGTAAARPIGWPAGEREERIPVRGVRKATAAAMVASAFTAPHVTEFLTVDVTSTMDLVRQLRALPEFADVRVSPLLLVAKALLLAVRRHPMINASWDEDGQQIVVHHYVNLGIAAATPRGLVVPNIKDAERLSLPELACAIGDLVAAAREGRTPPSDMLHGTITITNVGVFGVDSGTPILNRGEAAILCFGAVRPMPWVHEGELAVRQVTQLALSFDHRLVDGQLGSEVLADVGSMLSEPARIIAYG